MTDQKNAVRPNGTDSARVIQKVIEEKEHWMIFPDRLYSIGAWKGNY